MGKFVSDQQLLMRWVELCADPRMRDLGGKVELNGLGVIEMSPASNLHGLQQMRIGRLLGNHLVEGQVIGECVILTADGIRVPDVAWASNAFVATHGLVTPFPCAPELCIEVRSPSNTDPEMQHKIELYLQAGAVEVWIVDESGQRTIHDASGERPSSRWTVPF